MQEESKNQEVALDESALSHSQISGGSEENKKKKRKRLGKYIVGDIIGKGGAAIVHQGYNTETKEYVAIKKFTKGLMSAEQINAVKAELTLMSSLIHPNIVRVLDSLEDIKSIYIILEYVDSGSLAVLLRDYGGFPPPLVARLVAQILKGLDYLHKQGIIHRDIKAANLLITKDGVVKLADFGASAKLKDDTEKRYSIVGTPYWIAPEVIQMSGHRMASDIWSLGCTVVELVTGHPPYWELDQMRAIFCVVQEPKPPLPENIPDDLKDFLDRCFVKDPTQRATVEELLNHPFVKSIDLNQPLSFREIKKQLKLLKKSNLEKSLKVSSNTKPTTSTKMKSLTKSDIHSQSKEDNTNCSKTNSTPLNWLPNKDNKDRVNVLPPKETKNMLSVVPFVQLATPPHNEAILSATNSSSTSAFSCAQEDKMEAQTMPSSNSTAKITERRPNAIEGNTLSSLSSSSTTTTTTTATTTISSETSTTTVLAQNQTKEIFTSDPLSTENRRDSEQLQIQNKPTHSVLNSSSETSLTHNSTLVRDPKLQQECTQKSIPPLSNPNSQSFEKRSTAVLIDIPPSPAPLNETTTETIPLLPLLQKSGSRAHLRPHRRFCPCCPLL